MASTTSCFNSTLYRKTLQRFWPLWALYALFWLFLIPFSLLSRYLDNLRWDSAETAARWLAEGTMYHIFLDRFCRGSGAVRLRPGAQENPDWANGVPQFAPRPGDPPGDFLPTK